MSEQLDPRAFPVRESYTEQDAARAFDEFVTVMQDAGFDRSERGALFPEPFNRRMSEVLYTSTNNNYSADREDN